MNIADKIKMIRKNNNLSQQKFSDLIGVSRSYTNNIEKGLANPTPIFINCVAYTFGVDKKWLTDDSIDEVNDMRKDTDRVALIMENYEKLDDSYKRFVEKQIVDLLELQKENKCK